MSEYVTHKFCSYAFVDKQSEVRFSIFSFSYEFLRGLQIPPVIGRKIEYLIYVHFYLPSKCLARFRYLWIFSRVREPYRIVGKSEILTAVRCSGRVVRIGNRLYLADVSTVSPKAR